MVSNAAEYVPLASLDVTATSGLIDVDISSQIHAAIANGGGVRIALVDNTHLNTIKYYNDSGISSVIPEPATWGLVAFCGGLAG